MLLYILYIYIFLCTPIHIYFDRRWATVNSTTLIQRTFLWHFELLFLFWAFFKVIECMTFNIRLWSAMLNGIGMHSSVSLQNN